MKIYYDERQALHDPQTYFSRGKMRQPQEVPERLRQFIKGIEAAGERITTPHDFGFDPLTRIHGFAYIEFLRTAYDDWHALPEDWGEEVIPNIFVRENNALKGILAKSAKYIADGSAPIGKHTWESVYWSAQSAINGAAAVAKGASISLAISRPSGHHARREAAGGFCFVNNAAVAAQYLIDQKVAKRIVIFDTDVHHGQGIQEIFYDRDDVMYLSIHGDPTNFYPGVAGYEEERGVGRGEGFNINYPFPHGATESEFFHYFERALGDIRQFNPDLIIHNMGFDIYKEDPQSKTAVTREGFRRIAQSIVALDRPTLILIEGGYYLEGLANNLTTFIEGLRGDTE